MTGSYGSTTSIKSTPIARGGSLVRRDGLGTSPYAKKGCPLIRKAAFAAWMSGGALRTIWRQWIRG